MTSPEMTQMQIREIQTKVCETKEVKAVLKEMINVLQDDGFIVKNVSSDLGLLSAEQDISLERSSDIFFHMFLEGDRARWKKHSLIEVSANVSEFGEKTRVRANFQVKTFDNFGQLVEVYPVVDGKYYQKFFSKIDKGLFLQKEKL